MRACAFGLSPIAVYCDRLRQDQQSADLCLHGSNRIWYDETAAVPGPGGRGFLRGQCHERPESHGQGTITLIFVISRVRFSKDKRSFKRAKNREECYSVNTWHVLSPSLPFRSRSPREIFLSFVRMEKSHASASWSGMKHRLCSETRAHRMIYIAEYWNLFSDQLNL